MTRTPEQWLVMANWAERKANENSASDEPWALRNVRLYQGLMSIWLEEYHAVCRLLEQHGNASLEP